MKGTEKQVAWATEIATRVIAAWEAIKADRADEAGAADFVAARIDAIRAADYAGDIIDLFKDFRPVGEIEKDAMSLAAIYTVTIPCTEGQRKILCK